MWFLASVQTQRPKGAGSLAPPHPWNRTESTQVVLQGHVCARSHLAYVPSTRKDTQALWPCTEASLPEVPLKAPILFLDDTLMAVLVTGHVTALPGHKGAALASCPLHRTFWPGCLEMWVHVGEVSGQLRMCTRASQDVVVLTF